VTVGTAGPGKHLVPRGKAGLLPVYSQAKFLPVPRGETAIGIALNNSCNFVVKDGLPGALRTRFVAQDADAIAKSGGILGRGPRRCFLDQIGADQALHTDILSGVDALDHGISPGSKPVDPTLHGVVVFPNLGGEKIAAPVVIPQRLHRRAQPNAFPSVAIQNLAGHGVMAIGKNVRLHHHGVSNNPPDRELAAVDFGANSFHDNANPPFRREHLFSREHIEDQTLKLLRGLHPSRTARRLHVACWRGGMPTNKKPGSHLGCRS